MADTSIYRPFIGPAKTKAAYDLEASQADASALDVLMGKQKLQQVQRGNQRADALTSLMQGLGGGATDQDRMQALRGGGYFDEADKLDTSLQNRAKTAAEVDRSKAETSGKQYDLQRKKLENRISGVSMFTQPEDARQWLADGVVSGDIPMADAQTMIQKVPTDPTQFGAWRDQTLAGLVDAQKQLTMAATERQSVRTAETSRSNNAATNARAAAEGAANRGVAMRGQDIRKSGIDAAAARADRKGKGPGAMSATLQKELIESDEMDQQAQNTINALQGALKLNAKAYSGTGAKERATVRANVPGMKASEEADATIEFDNLIGSQALAGMKAIFGGNPTEGERAILLDLQASVNKTPKQREAIIRRGIAAAQRRQEFSKSKAKSIRTGTYLTEGIANPVDDALDQYGSED